MSYGFYVAEVVGTATIEDNRLQVRVLPHMNGIDSSKCPCWPSFFRDSLYTGKNGELVWVICDDEFSLGYVFGPANYNTYSDRANVFEKSEDGISLSIPSELRESISESSLEIDGLAISLGNAKVTYWDDSCVHFIERSGGGKIIAFKSGTLYVLRPSEFIVKIGKSVIKLDSDSISLNGSNILIQSDYVGLGNNTTKSNVMVNDGVSGEGAIKSPHVFA